MFPHVNNDRHPSMDKAPLSYFGDLGKKLWNPSGTQDWGELLWEGKYMIQCRFTEQSSSLLLWTWRPAREDLTATYSHPYHPGLEACGRCALVACLLAVDPVLVSWWLCELAPVPLNCQSGISVAHTRLWWDTWGTYYCIQVHQPWSPLWLLKQPHDPAPVFL